MNILEDVLKEFKQIAKIPRSSNHEEAIGNYLIERLKELGLKTHKDEIGNVIGERSATAGYEKKPFIIMQAHMDMVCVADQGYNYNPITDSIELKIDKEFLSANGTSLGADDGIGIAIILYILNNQKEHGQQRVIFTVDEEVGMTGAANLNSKYLNGEYLINVDSENVDEIVIGSAGSIKAQLCRQIEWAESNKTKSYNIKISGLKGGHSGEAIHIRHANAIKIMMHIIEKIDCELANINGGRAMNVIPSDCNATIVTNQTDVAEICKTIEKTVIERFEEPNLHIDIENVDLPERVIGQKDLDSLIGIIDLLIDGIYEEKTSANIGVLKIEDNKIKIEHMPRFHTVHSQAEMERNINEASRRNGYEIAVCESMSPWQSDKQELCDRMIEIAKSHGRKLIKRVIHGGLECSYFSVKNPKLEIVSIGTTNLDIHSPRERLLLSSVKPTVKLLLEVL